MNTNVKCVRLTLFCRNPPASQRRIACSFRHLAITMILNLMPKSIYQSWASPQVRPQVRNCGLTKKVADMRTCGLWQFRLRTCGCGLFLILVRNSASFKQILKFFAIFVKYSCFYPVKHEKSI